MVAKCLLLLKLASLLFLFKALGSAADSASPNAMGEVNTDGGSLQAAMLNNNAEDDDEEEEDGGTTEGCLTEDDENDETLEAGLQSGKCSAAAAAATSAAATMGRSRLRQGARQKQFFSNEFHTVALVC